jgi:hypothetical protein
MPDLRVCASLLRTPPFLSGKKEKQDEELNPQRLAEITGLRFPMRQEGNDERK